MIQAKSLAALTLALLSWSCSTLERQARAAEGALRSIYFDRAQNQSFRAEVTELQPSPRRDGPSRIGLRFIDREGREVLAASLLVRGQYLDFGSVKGTWISAVSSTPTELREARIQRAMATMAALNCWNVEDTRKPLPKPGTFSVLAHPSCNRPSYRLSDGEEMVFSQETGWLLLWGNPALPYGY